MSAQASNHSSVGFNLSDISPVGKTWEKHRANAERVAHDYATAGEDVLNEYAWRIKGCSELVEFKFLPEVPENHLKLKLSQTRFCRVRHCPVCQWRRSLMWKAKAYKILPEVVAEANEAGTNKVVVIKKASDWMV